MKKWCSLAQAGFSQRLIGSMLLGISSDVCPLAHVSLGSSSSWPETDIQMRASRHWNANLIYCISFYPKLTSLYNDTGIHMDVNINTQEVQICCISCRSKVGLQASDSGNGEQFGAMSWPSTWKHCDLDFDRQNIYQHSRKLTIDVLRVPGKMK